MIAAAASDGRIDDREKQQIAGHLAQSGFTTEATDYLKAAFRAPASIDTLAAQASTPELRAQVYTAARVAIDPDTAPEQNFLAQLAAKLGLAPELKANIDGAVSGVKA